MVDFVSYGMDIMSMHPKEAHTLRNKVWSAARAGAPKGIYTAIEVLMCGLAKGHLVDPIQAPEYDGTVQLMSRELGNENVKTWLGDIISPNENRRNGYFTRTKQIYSRRRC